MKKILAITLTLILAVALTACGTADKTESDRSGTSPNPSVSASAEAVTDQSVTAKETTDTFSLTSEDGTFSNTGDVYKITSAGTYTLSGLLAKQVLVEAGENDEVTIELSGATVTYGSDSPIKVLSAGKVDISAKKGTENVINDTRNTKTADDANQGEGAIYATCDLKIKGSGTLVVNAAYNNGIHTTKDLTVQNLSLKTSAYNNALKGNDSVTVESGTVVAIPPTETASKPKIPM